jgi:HAD superfamily hydrolase (TIGR01509 family)
MILAERLAIPDNAAAILWDMDGVLLDTLSFDYEICNRLLQSLVSPTAAVDRAAIRKHFPLDLPDFWRKLLDEAGVALGREQVDAIIPRLVEAHEAARGEAAFQLNPGIREVLQAALDKGLKLAVVSNNPTSKVLEILGRNRILEFFGQVIGNDLHQSAKKPAPDCYLLAARLLGVAPGDCVVVEDSLLGAEAGRRAGCFTVGVATGAAAFSELEASGLIDQVYTAFTENILALAPGNVTRKTIVTPNDFVSHMVEHIAWRLGCSIELRWNNSDWFLLGHTMGRVLARFGRQTDSAAVLGMIDDGSAEVRITASPEGAASFRGTAQVDLDWFLGLRCEQLSSGRPLTELLDGMAKGYPATLDVTVCSAEDPHHTWEGVFRSVGIAFHRMVFARRAAVAAETGSPAAPMESAWQVQQSTMSLAEVVRRTAESEVRVLLDCSGFALPRCRFEVSDSIQVEGLGDLLEELSRHAGCRLELDFKATRLSSSHVVMEDAGLVLGRALKEVLVQRMRQCGVNGAGSSIRIAEDCDRLPVRVGLSVEGRKTWTFVPFTTRYEELRRAFLVGHVVGRGLFTEDLDDFLDGFSGGLGASIVVHVARPVSPQEGWPMIFRGLGTAIAEALEPNPARKGVPPGVKATLG